MHVQDLAAAFPESLKLDDIFTALGVQVAEATRDTLPVHHLGDVLARMFPCPIPWQDIYVEMATAQGGDVTMRKYPDDDHFSVCQTAMPAAKEWLEGLRRTA